MCLNAIAAAAAESPDECMPCMITFITEEIKSNASDAPFSHFEYAPIVKHTENIAINQARYSHAN